jgi:hypothetical protein
VFWFSLQHLSEYRLSVKSVQWKLSCIYRHGKIKSLLHLSCQSTKKGMGKVQHQKQKQNTEFTHYTVNTLPKSLSYALRHLLRIYFNNQLWIRFVLHSWQLNYDYDYHATSDSSYLTETICKVILIVSGKRVDSITYKTPLSAFSSPSIVSFQCPCSRVLDTYDICMVCPNTFEERLKI